MNNKAPTVYRGKGTETRASHRYGGGGGGSGTYLSGRSFSHGPVDGRTDPSSGSIELFLVPDKAPQQM